MGHENAPAGLWDAVPVLSYKEMWQSLWLEVWDDAAQKYTTFADIEEQLAMTKPAGASKVE